MSFWSGTHTPKSVAWLDRNSQKNKNGGIERFKTGKHGKGLNECGIVGFVASESFEFWKDKVNSWIDELSSSDGFWNEDEKIIMNENVDVSTFSYSIAHRKEENDLLLHHFWIKI